MNRKRKAWKAESVAWRGRYMGRWDKPMKRKYYSQIQTLSINAHGLWACDVLTHWTLFTFRKSVTYKIRKTQRPDITLPETLQGKNNKSTSKKVQSRINTKSTEKRGKIRWQMKKIFISSDSQWWQRNQGPCFLLQCVVLACVAGVLGYVVRLYLALTLMIMFLLLIMAVLDSVRSLVLSTTFKSNTLV